MSFYEIDFLLDDKFNFNSFDPNESFQHSVLDNSFYNFGNEKKRTIFKLSNIDTLKEFISEKTEPISNGFMSRQENINIDINSIFNISNYNDDNVEEQNIAKDEDENNKTKKGRRKKNILYKEEAKHKKSDEDNIIRKIKTNLFNYITNNLNNNLKDKNYKFYPLDKKFHMNLKKDVNEELLEKKIYQIYENELNYAYRIFGEKNKKLINKIFEEKNETKVIAILNMTLQEMLNYIRENDLNAFLGQIRNKEEKYNKKSDENIEDYMKKVSGLLNKYEYWFKEKPGRNSEKKKQPNI